MPTDEVTVTIGGDGPDSLAVSATSLEPRAGELFGVELRNRATPAHVHCRLGGDLAASTSLEQTNYYVEPDAEAYVPIRAPDVDAPLRGTLEISTGYGANSVTIAVTIDPGRSIEVDETLAEPRREAPEPSRVESIAGALGVDLATLGVLGLGLVAVGVAVATAAVVGGPAAILGVFAVGIGVLVALWLLVSD